MDQTASGWYGSQAALEESWGGYIEQYGGSNSWDYWEGDGVHEIWVSDKNLYDKTIKVTLILDKSWQATYLGRSQHQCQQAPWHSTYVNYEYWEYWQDVEKMVQGIRHEWFHAYEDATKSNWHRNYLVSLAALSLVYEDAYTVHPDEVQARQYAGQQPYLGKEIKRTSRGKRYGDYRSN
jgi:hypothetical protein